MAENGRASAHLVEAFVHGLELWRLLLHSLIPDADEILRVTSVELLACNQVSEVGILLADLVFDVEGTEQNVDAHVVRSQAKLEFEALKHGIGEEEIRLDGIDIRAEDRSLNAVDGEGEFERLLVDVLLL